MKSKEKLKFLKNMPLINKVRYTKIFKGKNGGLF
jgi:hypothetical protein